MPKNKDGLLNYTNTTAIEHNDQGLVIIHFGMERYPINIENPSPGEKYVQVVSSVVMDKSMAWKLHANLGRLLGK